MRCFSKNLDLIESKDYIRQQLAYAGSPSDIFSDDAIEEIFHLSVGSPRLINKVCSHALIYGAQREKGVLSASDIRFVIEQEI
jgi:type II secretory pathway predicted ATPase ExeA